MNAKKKAPPQQEPSDDSGSDTSEDEEVLPKDQDLPVAEEESSSDEEEETQKSKKKKNKADKSESSDDKPVKPEEEKKTIFVGNLPVNTKKEHLKKFFEPNGKVKSVRLRSHTGKKVFNKAQVKKDPFITAYVVFEEETSANAAVEKSERTFRDRRIRVTPAGQKKATNKKTIFVGNLPYATVDEDLHEVFATCGAIESVRTIRGPNGCTGIAYVTFKEKNSLILALQMQGTMIRDRPIRLEKCKDLKKAEEKKNAKKQKTKVVTKVINGKHIKEKVPVTNADNALKRLKKKPGFDENQNQKKENNFKRSSGSGPPGRHQKFGRPGQKPDQKGGRPPFKGGRPDQKGGRPPFKGGPGGAGKKDFKAKAKKKGLPKNIQLAKRLNVNWKKPTYKAGPKKT